MESVAAPVAEIVVDNLFARIGRHVGYLFNYRGNILDVTEQMEKLRDGRVRVQQSVDEANWQGDEIFPDVEKWLSRADEIIKGTGKFLQDEREANRGCFNLKLRYRQSKKAKKQAADIVTKIQEAAKYGIVAHRHPPPGVGFSSVICSEVFESRETILDQVMEALRDDGIKMIGVWGMGGVGKTTLVQQVAKRAQVAKQANEEKLFDTVVMALNISQAPNVTKIQGDIASILGLKLEERDELARAVSLSQSLKKHKKILVILDDIWEPIALERIGIPYGLEDRSVEYCKVLLTSREHDVLSKDMGTNKDFHVQHLSEEEAWILFQKTVGDFVEKPELQHIATKVIKECEGLPVAIVTIAKALKDESAGVWRNALEELRRSAPTNIRGVSKNVYSCLELSYNHLESDEVKSVFLLCGLLGDDNIPMDDLLNYGMGLDLFNYMDSLEQARDKVVTIVKILKASSLLLDVLEEQEYDKPPSLYFLEEEGNGFVRMHDVIRDVARSIATKDPHRFLVKEDVSLQEWEERDGELRNCTGMSLKSTHVQELPQGLVCPKLGFFSLDSNGNGNSLKIPDTFFEEMKEVKVLSLSGVDLKRLPSSLHFLSNLRTLCLFRCGMLRTIAMLGELKKLQILSLLDCEILNFPEEIMQLTNLRMFSLRPCQAIIPKNVISSLSRLENLCITNCLYMACSERNVWFSGLKHLPCLRALEVEIPYSYLLPEDVSFDNLTRYDISIGCERNWFDGEKTTSRRLKLSEVKGPQLVKCFSKQLKTVEILDLHNLDDIKHFVNELDCCGFLHLKHLSISESGAMQYIMNTMEMERVGAPPSAFPLLKRLKLKHLKNLEAVWHGPIRMGCFANLRVLRIELCHSLKCILWLHTVQGKESVQVFPQLRWLELNYLPNLIDFYSTGINDNQKPLIIPFFNEQVALPQLELLRLKSMDNVRTMWHNQHPVGSCCKLKRLSLQNCENLQTVFPSKCLEGFQSLRILEIANCLSLKEIFEIDSIAVLPLKELSLHNQNMKSVGNKNPQGYLLAFQNLNSLSVDKCPFLKYIFPTSVVKGLVQLEILDISNCEVEEIVAANENGFEAIAPIFLFPKLTSLKLSQLCQLKRFYQRKYALECPLLTKLEVYNCDKVELLFQGKSLQGEVAKPPLFLVDKNTFPNVEELKLSLNGAMEVWRGQFPRETFGNLRNLSISEFHKLQVLHNVEQLTLTSCDPEKEVIQLEELVSEALPMLTEICLEDYLPMLTHLSGFGLGPILQNLHSLQVSKCGNLLNLISTSMAKRLFQLKRLSITACSMVKEIVGDDEASEEEALTDLVNLKSINNFAFPSLEEMEVKELPRLTHLYNKIPGLVLHDLQKLRILEVSGCGKIEILLTLSLAKTLVQLEKLIVKDCYKLKEIVEFEGGDDQSMDDVEIIFTKLQAVHLGHLPNLESFSTVSNTFTFPCLTDMRVKECPQMEYFCKGDSITPRLERVKVDCFRLYWENGLNATIHKMFMETNSEEALNLTNVLHSIEALHVLNVQHCEEEDLEECDSEEVYVEEEESEEEIPDDEDDEEGHSEEEHPKVEDSMEEDIEDEDSERGESGSLGRRSS